MKKVEAYWLVKQGRFKVILVGGKMRIMLDSFEEWYGRQFRYKKVNGPEPGQLLPASLTVPEAAVILGLNPGSVYELIKNHAPFETFKVDGQTRILKENFEAWYQGQSHYKKPEDAAPQELLDATLSVSDVARLLGIHRNSVYNMVNKPNHLAAAEMSAEGNYNQIDGIINNEALKPPSVLDNLRQCQEEAGKSQGGAAPPSRDPER